MSVPGPAAFGRGVIINAGQAVPAAWEGAAVVQVDDEALAEPAAVVEALHLAWSSRRPVVIALGVDPASFREPRGFPGEPWWLGATFDPWSDRLHFLVWANSYDARNPAAPPIWWWGRKAAHLAGVHEAAAEGDVLLADGLAAWIDGGPRAGFGPDETAGLVVIHRESVEAGSLAPLPPLRPPRAELAPDQLAAVGHRSGAARIIAPAGSGKTRVLTSRLRHLLADRGYERDGVLALAYNKKAQQEMQERTADVRPRIQTLNAAGYRLLAEARGGAPRLLDEREVRRLIERFVPIRRQRANTDPVGPYLEALGTIRLGLCDPEDVEEWRDDVPGLAAAFDPYRAALREAGAVDFDEQIYGAIEALLADGAFRRRAQAGCRHLLVDEFQDLTPAHVLLLRLLAAPQLDVFGVGDDDQVIYGHAGADPAFLIDFGQLFPGAGDHPLEVNYRCPATVVAQAATLLSHNQRRVAKAVRPGPHASPAPDAVRVVHHPAAGGAAALVEVVRAWLDAGVEPAGVAVLTRVNALLLAPQIALLEAGIPVDSALGLEALGRTGLRAALAYLRIAAAADGRIAAEDVMEIVRRPSRGLPQWFGDRIRRRTWWSLGQLGALAAQVPEKEISKVEWLVGDLEMLVRKAQAPGATTRSVLGVIKEGISLGGAMSLLDNSRGGEGSSHLDDLDALEQVAGLHPELESFETWLRDKLAANDRPGDRSGVTLSTVHRVKGMEWPRVAVFGVNGGIVPHRLAADVEEERRVLHVALTRCREQVVLLADASRPSAFLPELTEAAATTAARPPARGAAASGPGGAAPSGGGRVGARPAPAVGGRGRPAGGTSEAPTGPVDPVVEQALRTWRTERARHDRVSPYIVMHDTTLLAIGAARPRTLVALRRIDGIGPAKLEQYGDEILAVLATFDEPVVARADGSP
ncbi:MAG TPA: ATP-dependent DNA helicase UvrD2 [Acidimicrobiales bacterium]|nr:ATP-dependent DNA helicase UvrD2 [Acidimicrobiales bacterium]